MFHNVDYTQNILSLFQLYGVKAKLNNKFHGQARAVENFSTIPEKYKSVKREKLCNHVTVRNITTRHIAPYNVY